ncbi:MAG: PAS domain S-box protein [Acidobacteria bacterium]|nr:PAS domain S-box protein [Acidobacteriota bacterium]
MPVLSSPPEGASQRDPHGLLAALFSQRPDAVVVTDTNLNITEYAGGAEELYGWTRAEALGQRWPALVPTQLMSGGAPLQPNCSVTSTMCVPTPG